LHVREIAGIMTPFHGDGSLRSFGRESGSLAFFCTNGQL
jgi:hypothetical protein